MVCQDGSQENAWGFLIAVNEGEEGDKAGSILFSTM